LPPMLQLVPEWRQAGNIGLRNQGESGGQVVPRIALQPCSAGRIAPRRPLPRGRRPLRAAIF